MDAGVLNLAPLQDHTSELDAGPQVTPIVPSTMHTTQILIGQHSARETETPLHRRRQPLALIRREPPGLPS